MPESLTCRLDHLHDVEFHPKVKLLIDFWYLKCRSDSQIALSPVAYSRVSLIQSRISHCQLPIQAKIPLDWFHLGPNLNYFALSQLRFGMKREMIGVKIVIASTFGDYLPWERMPRASYSKEGGKILWRIGSLEKLWTLMEDSGL